MSKSSSFSTTQVTESKMQKSTYIAWPELPYDEFKSTEHLLHMGTQAIGKLKLATPFEPHWANVALYVTSRGLTTGLIPYELGGFSVHIDLISHQIFCTTTWGHTGSFGIHSMSVAELTKNLFDTLHGIGVDVSVNQKPQEVPNPINFEKDIEQQIYNAQLANAWWRILMSTYLVMQRYHARFTGKTQPIGFMWGTFDLRDVCFCGIPVQVPKTGPMSGYLRRNAMDAAQIEIGWWSGNAAYPRPAYYSFTYPQPDGIELAKIAPTAAHWDKTMGEFILDYDAIRTAKNPEGDLMAFFESTYQAGSELGHWDKNLVGPGKPL